MAPGRSRPAIIAGSHDPLLEWSVRESRCGLAILAAGSRAGVAALARGEATAAAAHWLDVLNAAGVPCGRVMSLPEVFDDPQVRHQQMRITIDHPKHGPLDVLGFPIKFTDDPCRIHRSPPELGADTHDILASLGYSNEDIAAFRERGVA